MKRRRIKRRRRTSRGVVLKLGARYRTPKGSEVSLFRVRRNERSMAEGYSCDVQPDKGSAFTVACKQLKKIS